MKPMTGTQMQTFFQGSQAHKVRNYGFSVTVQRLKEDEQNQRQQLSIKACEFSPL